ncbi:hypothetical protein LTS02_017285 [Friedmanniomyces endolithicus]|nr:hypothetical protein LTS02_017285 [Friedmanniomyces endolithicus]
MPVSFHFVPASKGENGSATSNSDYVANFASVGTLDDTPYLCIPAALEWRKRLTWGEKAGEVAIRAYNRNLARRGGRTVADILGTEVLENEDGTLGDCNMTNIRLPLSDDTLGRLELRSWIMKTMNLEYNIAVYPYMHGAAWWVRLSAQVYMILDDFEVCGRALNKVCARIIRGEGRQIAVTL